MEFPVIEQNLIGYKNKYAYIAIFQNELPESQKGKDNVYFEGVLKYDLEKEEIVNKIKFG
jgi:carotenoid cleavage dioxygenase-like enzyme